MSSTTDKLIIRAAAESQVGNARGNNEDNVYFNGDFITPRIIRQDFAIKTGDPVDINCFAVFDGMGRSNTGSFASLLAATRMDSLADSINFDSGRDTDDKVLSYVRTANAEIRDQINETGNIRTACTMALLIIENGIAHAYNAGDSRIYLFRDKHLTRLTRDHVERSAQGSSSNSKGDTRTRQLGEDGSRGGAGLTKYLGMYQNEGTLEPYRCKPFPVKEGDRFLICSDGITDFLTDEDIASVLDRNKEPFSHADELVNLALREESDDNLSAIVVEVAQTGFHVTQNMITTFFAALILLGGMLGGGLLGYIIGAGSVDVSSNFVDVSIYENVEAYYEYMQLLNQDKNPSDSDVSGSDVSGSDVSDSDISKTTTSQNSSSSTTTKYPTTTYPTTTTAPYIVEYFSLDIHDFTLTKIGAKHEFGIELSPDDTPKEIIQWKSSNEAVATVDQNGVVTAVSKGQATITATIPGLTEKDTLVETCIVRVKPR